MYRSRAFTLIELMIVVAVIAIIAAVSIPSLLGAKKGANEGSAIQSLRTLSTACEMYQCRNGGYPPNLAALAAAGLIDSTLASGIKSGYRFGTWNGGGNGNLSLTATHWRCFAQPVTPGVTGDRSFRNCAHLNIRYSSDGGVTWHAVQ